MAFSVPQLSLKGRALRLLSGREHSRPELERRLAPHEESPGELAAILDELQAKGFISEQRVVESVVHRKGPKLGAALIRRELANRGLSAEAVGEAVAGLQSTELARAREVWRKKFGKKFGAAANGPDAAGLADGAEGGPPEQDPSPAQRHQQMRFLAARGFGGDTIRRVMAQANGAQDDEDVP
jgi:regulatory protein